MTHINVDCNKCIECLERKKLEWCWRIQQEFKEAKCAYFTTLTYNNDNVPINKYYKLTLEPNHLQEFIKILRYHHSKLCKQPKRKTKLYRDRTNKGLNYTLESHINGLTYKDNIKYIACGEYGEWRGRPHYHLIIFNASNKHIEASWTAGNVYNVPMTSNQAAGYVLKYMDKKTYTDRNAYKYKAKEFLSFSEGIGLNYIEKMKEWHKRNLDVCYVPSDMGAMIPMPKYIRDRMFNELERKIQVQYIQDKLETERLEQLTLIGNIKMTEKIISRKNINRIKFNRSLKNRIVD